MGPRMQAPPRPPNQAGRKGEGEEELGERPVAALLLPACFLAAGQVRRKRGQQ